MDSVLIQVSGSLRAPSRFSWGKPSAAKPRGLRPLGFAALGLPSENPSGALTLPRSIVYAPLTLSLGDSFFHTAPRIFNSHFKAIQGTFPE